MWIDAVVLSWDPNINIGDNIHDGIPILFETSFPVSHSCYSLDGASNLTCVNETMLYIIKPGEHTLRLYANDTLDTWYESDLITFIIYGDDFAGLEILGDGLYYRTILITVLVGGTFILKGGTKKSERVLCFFLFIYYAIFFFSRMCLVIRLKHSCTFSPVLLDTFR